MILGIDDAWGGAGVVRINAKVVMEVEKASMQFLNNTVKLNNSWCNIVINCNA